MKIAIFGDVVGRKARKRVFEVVKKLKRGKIVDFIVVNGENAAGGFGITKRIFEDFIDAGVDVVSTGNHIWDQREVLNFIDNEQRLIRPMNFPKYANGKGYCIVKAASGKKVLVLNIMGQLFIPDQDCPFKMADELLEKYKLGRDVDAIIVDFHAEATSEKNAMGLYLDGRVSLVVGTHTHIPTADDKVLPLSTGYITDLGMCGDYYSVLGLEQDEAISRFVNKRKEKRLKPAMVDAMVCGVAVELDGKSGLCNKIEPIRIGSQIRPHYPSFLKECKF